MTYQSGDGGRLGPLRSIWNRITEGLRSPGRDAGSLEARQMRPGPESRAPFPQDGNPAGRLATKTSGPKSVNSSDELHIDASGSLYTQAQFGGQWQDERSTSPIARGKVQVRYASPDGFVLTPEQVKDLGPSARNALTMFDGTRAKVGFADSSGRIYSADLVSGMPASARDSVREKRLEDSRYISTEGRIFSAAEISRSHPDLRSSVTRLRTQDTIESGYVSERDGRLYTPEQAGKMRGRNLREVDMRRIDQGFVSKGGTVFGVDDVARMYPNNRHAFERVDLRRVNTGQGRIDRGPQGVVESAKVRSTVDLPAPGRNPQPPRASSDVAATARTVGGNIL